MPWLRAGTVAVTNGSTTVTGTNADFAANARTGDSFVGPDGLSYEVANVASATVISILPAYKGPTASGAAYAIMPVQGYDKMLSDAFNNLNNQFGPKLAALGTTGNYDVLPVTKGGTGETTAPGARTALGLGTAATRDYAGAGVARIATDAATMAKLPDGTWRGLGGFLDLRGTILERGTPTDILNIGFVTGFAQASALGIPLSSLPTASFVHLTVVTPLNGTVTTTGLTTIRTARAGAVELVQWAVSPTEWSAWSQPNVRGGANSTITSLSGLTTALSIAQGGTGAKTVAAAVTALGLDVATITNANGTAIRFPDGTQICTGYVNAPSLAIVDVRGSCFAGPYLAPPMFASAFIQPPVATMSIVGNTGLIWVTGAVAPTTTYFQGAYAMSPYSVTASAYISYMAVGRWK